MNPTAGKYGRSKMSRRLQRQARGWEGPPVSRASARLSGPRPNLTATRLGRLRAPYRRTGAMRRAGAPAAIPRPPGSPACHERNSASVFISRLGT